MGFLRPSQAECPVWGVALLCAVAVTIGIGVRCAWIDWAGQYEQFTWNGQLQPTTQDSFFHGSAIRLHAEGAPQGNLDRLPLLNRHGALHLFGTGVRVLLPVSTADILLWSPVFFGSLLAIPVVLIGRRLGSSWMGFGAAVLAVVAVNYFERTMAGYYDHDMLAFTAAAFVAWLLMEMNVRDHPGWLLTGSVSIFLYPFIYASGGLIVITMVLTWAFLRVLLNRHQPGTAATLLVPLFAAIASPLSTGDNIAARPLQWGLAFAALVLTWWWMTRRPPRQAVLVGLSLAGLLTAVFAFPWEWLAGQVQSHLRFAGAGVPGTENYAQIQLQDVLRNGIRETQLTSLSDFGFRLIGSPQVAIVAVSGLFALWLAQPRALILLPFAFVGAFASIGGHRFVTWGTVPAALGAAYLCFLVVRWLTAAWTGPGRKPVEIVGGWMLCGLMAWPSVAYDLNFRVPPAFTQPEIEAFHALRERSRPEDPVVAWWDYGGGIRYYAERGVFTDPGHVSEDTLVISHILTSDSQQDAARLSLALAEARRRGGSVARLSRIPRKVPSSGLPEGLAPADAVQYLIRNAPNRLSGERDVWIYMPLRELLILPGMAAFRPAPQRSDATLAQPLLVGFYRDLQPGPENWRISPHAKLAVNRNGQPGLLEGDDQITPIRFASLTNVWISERGETRLRRSKGGTTGPWVETFEGRMVATATPPDTDSRLHLVTVPQAHTMLIANEAAMRSNAIQMGLFGRVDPSLFEQAYASPYARVFRVRQPGEQTEEPGG